MPSVNAAVAVVVAVAELLVGLVNDMVNAINSIIGCRLVREHFVTFKDHGKDKSV